MIGIYVADFDSGPVTTAGLRCILLIDFDIVLTCRENLTELELIDCQLKLNLLTAIPC